jgi:hypothetical protein
VRLRAFFAERVYVGANPFRVKNKIEFIIPGLSLRSNPGLQLANAFGVFFKLNQYPNLTKMTVLQPFYLK